jgi:hypothetical protein
MAKATSNSFTYTFALIVRDQAGKKINGTVSIRDEDGTRRFAREILGQLPGASSVDVYLYGVNLETSDPVESVRGEA